MKSKNVNLIVAILAFIFFLSYFRSSEPLETFGISVSVWVFRLLWLFIAIINILSYIKKRKLEHE
ncbi:hypothetical protein GO491_05980 [Flavobacteriaceae bacterium Ap0902]|nr:hypothetical protein [Flavobacteriaceae bacterium Ap0902]